MSEEEDDWKEGKSDDNKPIEIDVYPPTFKRSAGNYPTLKKKLRASPSSLSSDVTELSLLRREQMEQNNNYRKMQFGLEQRKAELLEQEAKIRIAKEQVQLRADILWQRAQLLKEGVLQDEIDSLLPVPNNNN